MKSASLERLILVYQNQWPEMPFEEAQRRARELHRELERGKRNWSNSQRRFYAHCWLGLDMDTP